MAETESTEAKNVKLAIRIKEKFDFFSLALTFSILGLSIQTAKFGSLPLADWCEIAGWLLLLISGAAGLWRVEWLPSLYRVGGRLDSIDTYISITQQAAKSGAHFVNQQTLAPLSSQEVSDYRKTYDDAKEGLTKRYSKLDKWNDFKYSLQRWTFILGMLALVSGRAAVPIRDLVAGQPKASATATQAKEPAAALKH